MTLDRTSHGGNIEWAASIAGCNPEEILDFSASINPLGMPDSVARTLRSPAVFAQIQHYPDPNYNRLRQAIAAHHQISPDCVLPGNGVAELLTWVCKDLAAFDSVTLPVPAFNDYFRALKSAGANLQVVQLGFAQDADCLNDFALSPDPGGKSGILLNNPHNPTGKLYQRDRLIPLLDRYELVVIDEAFMDFLPTESSQSLVDLVESHPNLVILRSLTKFYALPGLRIGYAIAHPDRLHTWQMWRDPWSVNCLAMEAAIAALGDKEFQHKTWQWLPAARASLHQSLGKIPGLRPIMGAANFLLVESPEKSVIKLRDYLLAEHRILIRDCHSFPELGDRYFRLCVKTLAEQEKLLKVMDNC
jgi:L-threonine-O-3-phosphate decarboxylase